MLADGSIGEVEPSKTEIEWPNPRTVVHTEVSNFIFLSVCLSLGEVKHDAECKGSIIIQIECK